jgi:AbrB family looped-hinge helix DNA binding protein
MICHTFHTPMGSPQTHKPVFYGTATIGTKGQIVIPANARDDLSMQPGDKVVVFGLKANGMLGISPISSVEAMLAELTDHLEKMRKVVEDNKKERTA